MLTIGDTLPSFDLQAIDVHAQRDTPAGTPLLRHLTQESFPGRWKVLLSWPDDTDTLCSTELRLYSNQIDALTRRNSVLLGVSTSSVFEQLAERCQTDLGFTWLADPQAELCRALGIVQADGATLARAVFIIDPDNRVRHVSVNDSSVGRNPAETLRVLDALQTVELWPGTHRDQRVS